MADGIFIGLQRQPSKYAGIGDLIELDKDNCPVTVEKWQGDTPLLATCSRCSASWTYPRRYGGHCALRRDPLRGGLLT